jgi:hypothetical protein
MAMSLISVALFLHVLAAMGYSVATLISPFGLSMLRRAQRVEQARPLLSLLEITGPISGVSLLIILVTGSYMTSTTWGWQTAWIDVTLGSLLLLALPTGAVMGIRRHALATLANQMPDGPLPESLRRRISDPLLGASTIMLVGLLLGMVFLMTVKPELVGALIVMGISVGASLVLSLVVSLRQYAPAARPADRLPRSVSGH